MTVSETFCRILLPKQSLFPAMSGKAYNYNAFNEDQVLDVQTETNVSEILNVTSAFSLTVY